MITVSFFHAPHIEKEKQELIHIKKKFSLIHTTDSLINWVYNLGEMKRLLTILILIFTLQTPSWAEELKESIPEWFIKIPKTTDKIMYARGTALSKNSQSSKDEALIHALVEFAEILDQKITQTIKKVVTGEDIVKKTILKYESGNLIIICSMVEEDWDTLKCEDNRDLFNWSTLSGYTIENTETKQLANGDYRSFILLKYPIDKAYKEYSKLLNLKDTP